MKNLKVKNNSFTETQGKVRLVLIGERWAGKSLSGNTILRKERFECGRNRTTESEVRHDMVEGRMITVVDSPGWSRSLSLREIPEGDKQRFKLNASKCHPGPHAFLLIVPIDCAFSEDERKIVDEHMKLLGRRVWRYTMVLFTYNLADRSVEEHIEREHWALRWLVDKCQNKYHVMNNMKKNQMSQVTELLDKIEEMVAENSGQLFCPDMDDVHLRIEEKFERMQLKHVLKERLTQGYKMRELELITGFKKKLLELQDEIRGSVPTTKSKSLSEYYTVRIIL
uniref:AIG1-type G domain-containing protein n=1 Tax=Mastacembelus armatus TaxID=205130 RepID=A0A3Q3MK47_9TELE